jgi:hypothetical protein
MLKDIEECSDEPARNWLDQRMTGARWAEQMRAQ